jgi:hypothetical protein
VQKRISRTAAALATAIAIVVIGGAAVAGLAMYSKGTGLIPTSEIGDPSADTSGTLGPSASPEPGDDNGGDRGDGFCEPGDDCGGLRTPTPSYDDEYGDDHGGDDNGGDDSPDDGDDHGGDNGNSGPGGGHDD